MKPSTCTDRAWIYARHADIRDISRADMQSVGKWMLFTDVKNVDTQWAVIEHATLTGQLGIASKVSTKLSYYHQDDRVICVYTKDYADIEDVRRVLRALRGLGFTGPLSYKEDNATRKNMYGEGSTLYTSQSGVTFTQTREPVS